MKIIKAKNFKFRSDLENEVRNKYGLTPDAKPEVSIEGTRDELALLQLSDRSVFWGITCSVTDAPTVAKVHKKPERGEVKDFGINGRTNKAPKKVTKKTKK